MNFEKMSDIKVNFDKLHDIQNNVDMMNKMEMNFDNMSKEELVKLTSYLYRTIIRSEDIIKYTSYNLAKAQKSVDEEGFNDIYNAWKGEMYGWAFSEWEKNFKDLKNDGFLEIGKETIIY
jgi:hypothetical protein